MAALPGRTQRPALKSRSRTRPLDTVQSSKGVQSPPEGGSGSAPVSLRSACSA